MSERCSTCRTPLVWVDSRLVCPNGQCPGHAERDPVIHTSSEAMAPHGPRRPHGRRRSQNVGDLSGDVDKLARAPGGEGVHVVIATAIAEAAA